MGSLAALFALMALGGCRFGEAEFTGELGGQAFAPGGTVFAYVDARDDNLVEEARPRVVVFMTWLVFDPAADLGDRSGATLADLRHELSLRDALALVFDDQGVLVPGATFESLAEGDVELEDGGLSARLHLTPERLSAQSSYEDYAPLATRRRANVRLDEARFTDAPRLSGSVDLELLRSDDDPGDARIGRVEGRFVAPLVEERVAERNLSLLGAGPLLGVPLAPRPGSRPADERRPTDEPRPTDAPEPGEAPAPADEPEN